MTDCNHGNGKRCGRRHCDRSVQIYVPRDFTLSAVAVNKRIPLEIRDVSAAEMPDVREKLREVYGGEKIVLVTRCGEEKEIIVDALSDEPCDAVFADAETLTEHGRFDFSDLREIMARLRGEGGCEWDRAQTHESIRINLIEEAYELVEAIDCKNRDMMLEESGDVLMQAVFHTQIASEEGDFGYGDMLTALCRKLLDRHTHIFGENHADNADQALNFWNEAKKKEKKYKSSTDAMERVPKNLPALLYAEKIQKIASKCGFDWQTAEPAADKVGEELGEFMASDRDHRVEEGGDLLFAAVNVLRLCKIEPETALREANRKFLRRFAEVERRVAASGRDMKDCTLEDLDAVWDEVKRDERSAK